jgi:hypothetical protein
VSIVRRAVFFLHSPPVPLLVLLLLLLLLVLLVLLLLRVLHHVQERVIVLRLRASSSPMTFKEQVAILAPSKPSSILAGSWPWIANRAD